MAIYDKWIAVDKKFLPFVGGFLEQPAWVMEILNRIDNKTRLVERIVELERKQEEEVKRLLKSDVANIREEMGLS